MDVDLEKEEEFNLIIQGALRVTKKLDGIN